MDSITLTSRPALDHPTLVAAFAGWPDAGSVATMAIRYVCETLGAHLFAEIRPEEFYVFTEVRPRTAVGANPWERHITWPSNELYFWKALDEGPDLVLLSGTEPNLKWSTFIGSILDLAEDLSVEKVVSLGGTLDSVPHTREPLVSGASSDQGLREALKLLSVRPSAYEGPTSIHSALLDACNRRGIPNASLWGHGPLYLQDTPNPRVCYALVRRLAALLGIPLQLDTLREAAHNFDRQVDEAVAKNSELQEYIRQLEEVLDESQETGEDMPSPEAVVKDLEDFLRRRGKGHKNAGSRPEDT